MSLKMPYRLSEQLLCYAQSMIILYIREHHDCLLIFCDVWACRDSAVTSGAEFGCRCAACAAPRRPFGRASSRCGCAALPHLEGCRCGSCCGRGSCPGMAAAAACARPGSWGASGQPGSIFLSGMLLSFTLANVCTGIAAATA